MEEVVEVEVVDEMYRRRRKVVQEQLVLGQVKKEEQVDHCLMPKELEVVLGLSKESKASC